jgi:hypothetical protein
MTDFKNRLGHDNFVWWIGVVEDRVDPLNVGRCKVRIFGSHTDNLQEIPTSELPWATPLYPVNDSRSFSTPMEGDYVFGFFMDGLSSQAPAMLGVFPAIPQQEPNEVSGKGFYANAKFTNSSLSESDAIKPVVYTDTPAMKPVRVGSPTTSATAYTYKGTGIEKSDNSRAHVCDIANDIRFKQALEALKSSQLFQSIRAAIEAITDAASASPLVTQIIQAIKVIRYYVRMIKEILDFINEVILEIARYVAYVAKLIAWILSLPARLLKMFYDCLAALYSAITSSLFSSVSSSSGSLVSEIGGLYKDVSATISTATSTVGNAKTLAATATATLNPKSYSGKI